MDEFEYHYICCFLVLYSDTFSSFIVILTQKDTGEIISKKKLFNFILISRLIFKCVENLSLGFSVVYSREIKWRKWGARIPQKAFLSFK